MKILARQLTVDMYDCKNKELNNYNKLKEILREELKKIGNNLIDIQVQHNEQNEAVIFVLLEGGHVVMRTYPELKYVASDVFLCQENSKPENVVRILRKIMKPEKIRMTYLKRGDFGTVKDVKPRIKIRIAPLKPLRSIKNKGAKVIKNVAKKIK